MGQYYIAVFVNDKKNRVECAQSTDAFIGDGHWIGCKLMEHSYIGNVFVEDVAYRLIHAPKRLVWAGDYGDDIGEQNFYGMAHNFLRPESRELVEAAMKVYTVFVNHDKKEWFDVTKQKRPAMRDWNGKIHPLPLLTADGNGRGGGDYHSPILEEMVGSWKGDLIELDCKAPEGYTEIQPWFTEIEDWSDEDDAKLGGKLKRYEVTRYFHTCDVVTVEAASEEEAIELAEDMDGDDDMILMNLQKDGDSDAECVSDGEE